LKRLWSGKTFITPGGGGNTYEVAFLDGEDMDHEGNTGARVTVCGPGYLCVNPEGGGGLGRKREWAGAFMER